MQLTPCMHLREELLGQIINDKNMSIESDDGYYRLIVRLTSPWDNIPQPNRNASHEFHSEKLNLATVTKLWDMMLQ